MDLGDTVFRNVATFHIVGDDGIAEIREHLDQRLADTTIHSPQKLIMSHSRPRQKKI